MHSKRQLYKPAPKQNVGGQKKVRKLVQGRLEVSSHFAEPEPSQNVTMTSSIMTNTDDPAMSPRRSVPALTEHASPRAEPPSKCLDLSDTELNLSIASSTSQNRQPVMVCDASHLASSSDNTEVEVLVNYEDSPAKVICHTSGRLRTSPRSVIQSPSGRLHEKKGVTTSIVDSPRTVSFTSTSNDDVRYSGEKALRNRYFISEHSRGIIKEILAEEIGSKDIDSISLYSHNSSPSNFPQSSSPVETSKHYSSPNNSHSSIYANLNKSPTSKDILKPISRGQLNFDDDSDASNSGNYAEKGRIDRTPKIEAAKALALKGQDSDSETCSLDEYVTQRKTGDNQKDKTHVSQEVVKKPKSAKKKPGRIVASRYMHSTTAVKGNQSSVTSSKDSISGSSNSQNVSSRPKMMSTKSSLKSVTSSTKLLNVTGKSLPPTPSKKIPGKKTKDNLTSTPTHDHSVSPYEMDASSIHQSTTMGRNESKTSDAIKSSLSVGKSVDKASLDEQQFHLDLQYSRYLQALFMTTQANKSFKEQEKQAMKQLTGLWQLQEKKRAALAQSRMELDMMKSLIQIDSALDKTETQLASLEKKLPQVSLDHSNLCSALGYTQHQIVTEDIYIPNKTEDEREAYEEKLESTLRESERLLDCITFKVGERLPTLHQYVTSLEAISGNVQESGNELRSGHKSLDIAKGLCSQLSSRMVLGMQHSSQ